MKTLCVIGLIVFILTSTVSCAKKESEVLSSFAKNLMNEKEITVYKPMDVKGVSPSIKLSRDGSKIEKISGYEVVYQTTELNEVARLFAQWEMADNVIPDGYSLDLLLETVIQIGDKHVIQYSQGQGESTNWYGMIDNRYYYVPEEFCRFIDSLK